MPHGIAASSMSERTGHIDQKHLLEEHHMRKHMIRIIQVFKATRVIEIEVEPDDEGEAVEVVSSGSIDTPDFDDPRWKTG